MEFLTDDETEFFVDIATAYSKHGPLTSDEIDRVVQWAECARMRSAVLTLILEGKVVVTWDRDAQDVRFWAATHFSQC